MYTQFSLSLSLSLTHTHTHTHTFTHIRLRHFSGKSSFLNALLGSRYLDEGVTPTTHKGTLSLSLSLSLPSSLSLPVSFSFRYFTFCFALTHFIFPLLFSSLLLFLLLTHSDAVNIISYGTEFHTYEDLRDTNIIRVKVPVAWLSVWRERERERERDREGGRGREKKGRGGRKEKREFVDVLDECCALLRRVSILSTPLVSMRSFTHMRESLNTSFPRGLSLSLSLTHI